MTVMEPLHIIIPTKKKFDCLNKWRKRCSLWVSNWKWSFLPRIIYFIHV